MPEPLYLQQIAGEPKPRLLGEWPPEIEIARFFADELRNADALIEFDCMNGHALYEVAPESSAKDVLTARRVLPGG